MGNIYKLIELVGSSEVDYAEATRSAVREAARTIRDIAWFEVVEHRGKVVDGEVKEFQVKLRIAFKVAR